MELNLPQLTVFKYKHGDSVPLSPKRKLLFIVSLMLAPFIVYFAFPPGLIAAAIPFVVFFGRSGTLELGPRYLICGDTILYYANVTQLTLQEAEGRLSLQTASGKPFVIERGKFPTNARKKPKIAANQAAKFAKVSARIVEKVRRTSPANSAAGA